MKKPENVENDKNKVESSRELTDTELDAIAGGHAGDVTPPSVPSLGGNFAVHGKDDPASIPTGGDLDLSSLQKLNIFF